MEPTPQEPAVAPDALVRAQLAPDRKAVAPGLPGWLTLIVDNHDRRSRAVQLQLGGAMSRFSTPRLSTIDMLPGEQREVLIEVAPKAHAPEGGHDYELTVTATDLSDGTFLDRSTARLSVAQRPALKRRPTGRVRTVDGNPFVLRVVVYNSGNVPLRVDVYRVARRWWVRDAPNQRTGERLASMRRGIGSVLSDPVGAEQLRPGEHWTVELPAVAPRYQIGLATRRWLIPVAVRAHGWGPECVFVELDQAPRTLLPLRVAVLGVAVLVALVVLIALMGWLAG